MSETLPIDVETIRRNAGRVPAFDSLDEAEAYGLLLAGHVRLLLPQAKALAATRARDGAPRIITWAKDTLRQDCGDTLTSAVWHVEDLAIACRLLLSLVRPEAGAEFCAWCRTNATGVRTVSVFEAGSGPGSSLGACAPCREAHNLTLFTDRQPLLAPAAPQGMRAP